MVFSNSVVLLVLLVLLLSLLLLLVLLVLLLILLLLLSLLVLLLSLLFILLCHWFQSPFLKLTKIRRILSSLVFRKVRRQFKLP